jgi:hypothetical protein
MMRRREFISLLGGGAAAWPLAARAQQPAKLPTIGFSDATTPSTEGQWVAAFVQRLGELGWVEGRAIAIEYRWAEGRAERAAEIAAELVRMKVDVILASGTANVVAAKQATSSIPIVFAAVGDPVGTGLVRQPHVRSEPMLSLWRYRERRVLRPLSMDSKAARTRFMWSSIRLSKAPAGFVLTLWRWVLHYRRCMVFGKPLKPRA